MTFKGKSILSILVLAVVLFTLVIPALASDETENLVFNAPESIKATLNFDKQITHYDWALDKKVQSSITLNNGDSQNVAYTIEATRSISLIEKFYSLTVENVKIQNTGKGAANQVSVKAILEAKASSADSVWVTLAEQAINNLGPIQKDAILPLNFNAITFKALNNYADYRLKIVVSYNKGELTETKTVSLDDDNTADILDAKDAAAILTDTLGSAPTGFVWMYVSAGEFPQVLNNTKTINYNVQIQNLSVDEAATIELSNIATLTEIDTSTARMDTAKLLVYVNKSDQNDDGEDDDDQDQPEISYPAAPAVANAILKEKGMESRYEKGNNKKNGKPEYGNYIAEVAKAMTQEAKFPAYDSNGTWNGTDFVEKSSVDAYKTAIYNFLESLKPEEF